MRRWIAGLLAGLSLSSSVAAQTGNELAPEVRARAILDDWAQTLGGRTRLGSVQTWHLRSAVRAAGLEGTLEEWQTAGGQRYEHFRLGDVYEELTVFDGEQAWLRDQNGKVRLQTGPELQAIRIDSALGALAHLLPGRAAVEAEVVEAAGQPPALKLVIEGGEPMTYRFDPTTGLPTQVEYQDEGRSWTMSFADWREVEGLRFPFQVHLTPGDPRSEVKIHLLEARVDEPVPAGLFSRPEDPAPDFRFASEAGLAEMPFEMSSNHVYVQARVQGQGPFWCVLDTGAEASVLNERRARELGLPLQGQLEGHGAGPGSVDVSFVSGVSFGLPGVELTDQTVMAIPLDQLSRFDGRHLEGILGYDLFSRFVVEIDYAAQRVRLHDPKKFHYAGVGTTVPISIAGGVPFVEAEVTPEGAAPIRGRFLLDTGARSALDLNRPTVDVHRLLETGSPKLPAAYGVGIGGETKTLVGRVQSLRIGSVTLVAPVTGFSRDGAGADTDPGVVGSIGGDVFRRFRMFFDYDGQRMILEPNQDLAQPFGYDTSGTFLVAEGANFDELRVHRLLPGSPAAEAGLEVGDRILALDGKPTAELTLEMLRRTFQAEGVHDLTLERAGKTLEVRLKLRKLV